MKKDKIRFSLFQTLKFQRFYKTKKDEVRQGRWQSPYTKHTECICLLQKRGE